MAPSGSGSESLSLSSFSRLTTIGNVDAFVGDDVVVVCAEDTSSEFVVEFVLDRVVDTVDKSSLTFVIETGVVVVPTVTVVVAIVPVGDAVVVVVIDVNVAQLKPHALVPERTFQPAAASYLISQKLDNWPSEVAFVNTHISKSVELDNIRPVFCIGGMLAEANSAIDNLSETRQV